MPVTVAIPCYNHAPYIGRCVQAVLDQTCKPDRVLVIDDGSTDETAAVVRQYPVELLQHGQNRGLSAGRNTALEHADTGYLVYVDSDAYADPHMLESLLAEFERGEVDGVGGQGVEAVQESLYDRWRKLHASQGYGQSRIDGAQHLFGLCMAYRPEALKAVGAFDPNFRTNGEDMDIGYRLVDAGFRLVYTPEARVYHQRKDNHASLRRMMHQWYFGAFIAKYKNGRSPWKLAAGTLRRLLWNDTWPDLFKERSPGLAKLDLELALVKLQALRAAARSVRKSKT